MIPAVAGIDSVPAVPAAVASGPLPSFAAGPPTPAGLGLGFALPPATVGGRSRAAARAARSRPAR